MIKLNQFCDQIQLKSNVWLTPLLCIKRKNDSGYTFVWQWIRWKYQNSERISTENSQIYLFDNNMVLLSKFLEWKAYIEKSHKNPSAFTIEPSICTITCKSGTWEKSSQKWKRNRMKYFTNHSCVHIFIWSCISNRILWHFMCFLFVLFPYVFLFSVCFFCIAYWNKKNHIIISVKLGMLSWYVFRTKLVFWNLSWEVKKEALPNLQHWWR